MGPAAPAALAKLPMSGLVMPFLLLQLGVWSILLGVFFIRPRGPPRRAKPLVARPMIRL